MESRYRFVSLIDARSAIAAHLLRGQLDARLGEITLAAHQLSAARRVASLLTAHGGALLADDVGLGKTYVALAVARRYVRVLVIAPAALQTMWRDAASRARVEVELTSYEALSRGNRHWATRVDRADVATQPVPTIVILDEAHHARTPDSRRYPRIAALTRAADTLLLTATPVPNRLADLRSLVALFAGSRVSTMSEADLSLLVYRRTAASVAGVVLPNVAPPRWIEVDDDSACLDALQRLPPPVPPAGSGDGGALLLLGLVRQWASSRAALVGALRRSLARSLALKDSIAAGRLPTARELGAWAAGDDGMQLAFPEMVAAPVEAAIDARAFARALSDHAASVSHLLALLARLDDPDAERARHIAGLQDVHAGAKIVCFTGYAETAAMYWRRLRTRAGVARLSARGGEIASGRVRRDEVLQLFAPIGQRVRPAGRIEDVTLLITTDLLSEGVDLQDATVVVHLDLPWSPARMEQRLGRARRMGSSAPGISAYAMRPPASSERVLAIERRLREKLAIAARSVGAGAPVLPSLVGEAMQAPQLSALSQAERRSALLDRISCWSAGGGGEAAEQREPVVAIAMAPAPGWLAAIDIGRERLLIASVNGRTGGDTSLLERACDLADSRAAARQVRTCSPHDRSRVNRAAVGVAAHAAELAATNAIAPGSDSLDDAVPRHRTRGIRSRALARIHRALAVALPHHAPRTATLAAAARQVVSGRLSAGMEQRLDEISSASGGDELAWLEAVAGLATVTEDEGPAFQLRVLIVFVPTATCPA